MLRLSRPKISQPRLLVNLDDKDEPEDLLDTSTGTSIGPEGFQETSTFSFEVKEARPSYPEDGPLLNLPSTFGSLYVGETFKALLSLHSEVDKTSNNKTVNAAKSPVQLSTGLAIQVDGTNVGQHPNTDDTHGQPATDSEGKPLKKVPDGPPYLAVTLTVSLSTPEQKHPIALIRSSDPDATAHLAPGSAKQFTVDFETSEVGVHTISATVTYTPVQPIYPEKALESSKIEEGKETADLQEDPTDKASEGLVPVKETDHPLYTAPSFLTKQEPVSFVSVGPSGSFTKTYRFTTENGFNIGTKMTAIAHDTYVIQTRIENLTDTTISIETAEFLAPVGWVSKSLATTIDTEPAGGHQESSDADTEKFGQLDEYGLSDTPTDLYITNINTPSLMPKESWQFAYLVEHDPEFFTEAMSGSNPGGRQQDGRPVSMQNRQSVGTGKFSFSWRREPLGEKGWLMTGHLKRTTSLEYWG